VKIKTTEDFYTAVKLAWETRKEIDRFVGNANSSYKEFTFAMKKGAAYAFEAGKILNEIWGQLDARDSWPDWCREHLPFDVSTANRYLRIYENFKDNPRALAGLTASGALKLLSSPKTGGGE
jgi:hypothetical protein